MSLRTVDVRTAMGEPQTVIFVPQVQVSLSVSNVTLVATNDDGAKITALVTFSDGRQKLLTLFEGMYYEPIQNFTNTEVDNRIKEIITA
jgi:hypothetical protein